jgi:hypothetical protein
MYSRCYLINVDVLQPIPTQRIGKHLPAAESPAVEKRVSCKSAAVKEDFMCAVVTVRCQDTTIEDWEHYSMCNSEL